MVSISFEILSLFKNDLVFEEIIFLKFHHQILYFHLYIYFQFLIFFNRYQI